MKLKELLKEPYFFIHDLIFQKYNSYLEKNIELKNKYLDKRCFLLLPGESLTYLNLKHLRNEYTAAPGFFFLHKDFDNLEVNFMFNSGMGQGLKRKGKDYYHNWPEQYLPSDGKYDPKLFFYYLMKKINNKSPKWFLNHDYIKYYSKIRQFDIEDERIYYLKMLNLFHKKYYKKIDLTKRFVGGGAAIINSILVLIYMGFKEIYLCGAGYTYDPIFHQHFYDNFVVDGKLSKEHARIEILNLIANSIDKDILQLKDIILYEKNWRAVCTRKHANNNYTNLLIKLKDVAGANGTMIYNIVPDGFSSPVFKTIRWNQVIENK